MAIEGINTAMTALQFAAARSRVRTIENMANAAPHSAATRPLSTPLPTGAPGSTVALAGRVLAAASFHCTYRPLPGTSWAKRMPQLADSAYWSFSLNRLG